MEGGKWHDEIETSGDRATEEQIGSLNNQPTEAGPKHKGPTTPGTGGGVNETGTPGPGPSSRAAGGAKDPTVSHDIPPSAH
jgi:hypothetical protein